MNFFNRHDPWPAVGRGMRNIALATIVFALWHSLLCSTAAKQSAKTIFGERKGTALFRLFFMIQSAVAAGGLFSLILTQPHRVIYRARGWKRWVGWMGQGGSLLLAYLSLREMDKSKFLGFKGRQALQEGEAQIPEAEAQGPEIDIDGEVHETGVFQFSRHPLDWAPILLLWFSPTLKTNWFAFNALAAIYAVLGAKHEEERLLRHSREAYERYQKRVPFFFGWPRRDE